MEALNTRHYTEKDYYEMPVRFSMILTPSCSPMKIP